MRKILKDTFILAALMILIIFSFSVAGVGLTDEILLVYEIFGLALALSVFNYFFDEKTSFSMIAGYLIKFAAVSIMVIAFGFIVGWFFPSNFWMAFIYVGVITAIVYALDSVKIEQDVEDINEMVKLSKNEKAEAIPLRKRNSWKVLLVLLIAMALLFVASLIGFSSASAGRPALGFYCLHGMFISAIAAAILAVLLFANMIVYTVRQKKTAK